MADVSQLTPDFGLDVQGRFAAADAPCAPRLDEVADLGQECGVDPRAGELHELLLDVERRLAAARAVLVASLEHLPDLLGADAGISAGGLRRGAVHREPALADLVVGAPGARKREDREQRADAHDTPKHDPERVLHAHQCGTTEPVARGPCAIPFRVEPID